MKAIGFDDTYFCESTNECLYVYPLKNVADSLREQVRFSCLIGFLDYALIVVEPQQLTALTEQEAVKHISLWQLQQWFQAGKLEWSVVMRTNDQFQYVNEHARIFFKGNQQQSTLHLDKLLNQHCQYASNKQQTWVDQAYVDRVLQIALQSWLEP